MKRLLFVIALLILFSVNFSSALAQTPTATPTPTAQEELNQLNTEVIKLYSANKLEEALPLAEKVVQRTQALLGADSEQLIAAWRNLGEIQLARKKYKAAVASFEQAVKVQETKLGAVALPLAETLMRLGIAYLRAEQTDGAEKSFARVLAIREEKLPANHPLTAEVVEFLAQLYSFKRDWDEAAKFYQKAYTIKDAGQQPPDEVALAAERYGCALLKAGRKAESDALAEKRQQAYLAVKSSAPNNMPAETVQMGIMNGQARRLPPPVYPNGARTSGTVSVKVLINEQGQVIHACALVGPQPFWGSSEAAAYQAQFSSMVLHGKPVKVVGTLMYAYVR